MLNCLIYGRLTLRNGSAAESRTESVDAPRGGRQKYRTALTNDFLVHRALSRSAVIALWL